MTSSAPCPQPVRVRVWFHRSGRRGSLATLRHVEGEVVLEVHDVSALLDIGSDQEWHDRAAALAARGQRIRIMHDGLLLLTIGAGEEPASASGHMRVGSWAYAPELVGAVDGDRPGPV